MLCYTDNNPLTVYNNGTSMPSGANTGHTFIFFDDMCNAGTQAALNDHNGVPTPKVTQYEVGFKTRRCAGPMQFTRTRVAAGPVRAAVSGRNHLLI